MRIPAFSLMRTHFHFLLWPRTDVDMPEFMKWLEGTHTMGFHRTRGSRGTGAVYQSRYVSRLLPDDRNYLIALRYVERNALVAGYVQRAEDWPWCSSWHGEGGPQLFVADASPIPRPPYWTDFLNEI
jgi:putative transposase